LGGPDSWDIIERDKVSDLAEIIPAILKYPPKWRSVGISVEGDGESGSVWIKKGIE
jgi:hypothetical protein